MKKFLLVLLSALVFLFTACDNWMQDDDFYNDIEEAVKVANATQINVYTRYALTRQGKTEPDGYSVFKVGIPHIISATTEPEYGFVRWAAFTTDFIAPGDNQSKNKDIYYIDEEDYNTRLKPHEIQYPLVVFGDPKSSTTTVIINSFQNDIFLVPVVAQRPSVSLTIPAKGSSGVVRNISVRINFTKPMDEESFKNEAGEYDKITVTQGIQSFTADGDIEINSEDITDYFDVPQFSKNKKMVTLKFKPERLSEGYSSQSSVNITISKDVKDVDGFTMADDDKISFSVGSYKDTLAPRITQLTAGRSGTDFNVFQGVYKDTGTINSVGATTKMTLEGAENAPTNDINASFFDPFIPYRIKGKVVLRVFAEDIAGSGTGQSQTGIETDVAMIGMRAYHMYNMDGTTSTFRYSEEQEFKFKPSNYLSQSNLTTTVDGAYKNLVQAINETIPGTENDFAVDKGCLLDFDLSDLPDGLIRIDVAAVDMVQNSGFTDGGAYSDEYGNAWASLFVIKDTTPPDAASNNSFVTVDTSAASHITVDNYFNELTFSNVKIAHDVSSIADSGHARLRSPHDSMKWIVKPTSETSWINTVSSYDPAWRYITSDYSPFPTPANDGPVYYTYALMDDMGNMSSASGIPPIYYDSVPPVLGTPYLVAAAGYTAGVAMDNILDEQTLVVPVTEMTSGLKSIEVKVRKAGASEDYASPLSDAGLVVTTGGVAVPFTLDSAKKVLIYNQPQTNFNSSVTIRGIKLSDVLDEQGSFEIKVLVKDAAAADGVHETLSSAVVSNTDSVAPVINQIYIPYIKATERVGATGTEYWRGTQSTADLYVTFTEETSGAKIFDFAGSSINLTADSAIYRVDPATNAVTSAAIGAETDTSANRMTITSSVDAAASLAGSGQLTVKITNVALAAEGTPSSVALKIYDTATNASATASTISSNEDSINLAAPALTTTSFKYDSGLPGAEGFVLKDRQAGKDTANHFVQADSDFTNENTVNANITLTQSATNSGIISITIAGDATFTSDTEIYAGTSYPDVPLSDTDLGDIAKIDTNGNYLKSGGTQVLFDISADGKTATFKTAAGGHLVIGTSALAIKNLALTSGDGLKSVTIKPRTICGLEAAGASDTITIDTIVPVWNGKGLYSQTHNNVNPNTVYPHSVDSANAASAYGFGFGTYYGGAAAGSGEMEDLYFYRASNISIGSDVTDTNFRITRWIKSSDNSYSDYQYNYGFTSIPWTAIALDRAGNQSKPITLNLIEDSAFAPNTEDANIANIDRYMTIDKPGDAFIHRNAESTGLYEYVIKGVSDYKIKVMLGGASGETIENAASGGTELISTPYVFLNNSITSPNIGSKIEKYTVFTNTSTSGNITDAPATCTWLPFATSAVTTNQDSVITTYVDGSTIVINLPHNGCDPLVLGLMDGCGNTVFRRIRRAGMTSGALKWTSDNRLGLDDSLAGSASYSWPADINTTTDVTFYNSTATLTLENCSDTCRFDPYGPGTAADLAAQKYTMRSRILVWPTTKANAPTQLDFQDGNLATDTPATDWYCYKEAPGSLGINSAFSLVNEFPQPSVTTPYRLYYIIEDTVGNCRITKITRDDANGVARDLWLFDNTPPAVSELTYNKVNTISGVNYYSYISSVDFTVTDDGSGVWKDSVTEEPYSTFGQRSTVPVHYSLNNIDPVSGSLKIDKSNIYDYAGKQITADIVFNNGGSSTWQVLNDIPELADNAAVAVNKNTLTAGNPDSGNVGLTDNTSTSPNTGTVTPGGQKLELTAKWAVTDITLRLYTTMAQSDMLGWVVETAPRTTSESDFVSSVSNLVSWDDEGYWKYEYTKENSSDVLWHDKDDLYFYPVSKAGRICLTPVLVTFKDNYPPTISDGTSADGYHYSANGDIGIINPTYLAHDKVADYKIKVSGTGDSAINYTRLGASVTFATTRGPTKYRFVYSGSDGQLGTNDDPPPGDYTDTGLTVSDSSFTISLNSVNGNALGIQLARYNEAGIIEEDSAVYPLYGPTFSGHTGSNNWVYDSQSPGIGFVNTNPPIMSGSASGTVPATFTGDALGIQYIEDATVYIKFTLTYKTASDRYQWKTKTYDDSTGSWSGWTNWSDFYYNGTATGITSFNTSSGELTFPAPESKTQYAFRVIDAAGNISGEDTTAKLQRDQWAPEAAGGLVYHLRRDATDSTNVEIEKPTMVSTSTVGGVETHSISYGVSGEYKVDRILIDLSNVTDKRDSAGNVSTSGIERSGIQAYEVTLTIDNGAATAPAAPAKDANVWEITGLSSHENDKEYEYTLKVKDNLGKEKVLKTFKTIVDNNPPDLELATTNVVQKSEAADGSSPANCEAKSLGGALDDGVYYLNKDYAVINFTKTANDIAVYKMKTSIDGTNWTESNITSAIIGNDTNTPKYVFEAPDEYTTMYRFKAIDGVENDSVWTDPIKIRKDAEAPSGDANTVAWAFYKDDGATAIGNTYYDITNDGTESKSITYNGGQMNKFELALSAIENAAGPSGIRRYWLTTDSYAPDPSTGNSDFDATNKKWKFDIAESGSTQEIYKIRAEDWAGNFTEFREFKLTPDVDPPNISFAATNKVPGAAEIDISGTTVYFFNAAATNAVINLSSTSGDNDKYEVSRNAGSSYTTIDGESGLSTSPSLSYTFAADTLTSQTTFKFKVTDKVGNYAETTGPDTVTLVQDAEAPALDSGVDALTFGVLKENGDAAALYTGVNTADYTQEDSADGKTSTITYNPAVVKTIAFNNLENELSEIETSGAVSGFEKLYYKAASDITETLVALGGTGFNVITLGDNWNDTYYIYAKDKAGNLSEVLKTLVLTADSTAELNSNYVTTDGSVKKIHSYTAVNASDAEIGIHWAYTNKIGSNQIANIFTSGTKIKYAKTALPGIVDYMLVKCENTGDYDATTTGGIWESLRDGTTGNSGDYFVFPLPDIKTANTRLAFYFRDAVGNQSGPYYLGNKAAALFDIQWWMTTPELTADNITIESVTYSGGSGWAGVKKDYTVTVQLPAGTVIHSVFLGPKPNGGNTGFVLSTSLDKFEFSGYGTGTGYTATKESYTKDANDAESGGYLILPSSEGSVTGKITIGVYPWDSITAYSEPVIKFNGADINAEGVSKQIFTDPNAGSGGGGGPDPNVNTTGLTGITGRIFGNGSEESAGSRIIKFFTNSTSVDAEETAVKPKANKSAAKKAAKKAKKAVTEQKSVVAEATSAVVSTGSTTVNAESTNADVSSPIMAEASAVVAPTAAVVSTSSTTVSSANEATLQPADIADDEKSTSKAAVIVVMLAALSGAGGVWLAFKARKK